METNKWVIFGLILLTLCIYPVAAAVYRTWTIRMTGTINTIGCELYADAELTIPLTSYSWGDFFPGDMKQVQVWVKSTSTVPATLSVFDGNWSSVEAQNFIVFNSMLNGIEFQPQEVKTDWMTLTVLEDIAGVTSFSFDITYQITGG
jgi:hypothetical protein